MVMDSENYMLLISWQSQPIIDFKDISLQACGFAVAPRRLQTRLNHYLERSVLELGVYAAAAAAAAQELCCMSLPQTRVPLRPSAQTAPAKAHNRGSPALLVLRSVCCFPYLG